MMRQTWRWGIEQKQEKSRSRKQESPSGEQCFGTLEVKVEVTSPGRENDIWNVLEYYLCYSEEWNGGGGERLEVTDFLKKILAMLFSHCYHQPSWSYRAMTHHPTPYRDSSENDSPWRTLKRERRNNPLA